jgi:hypothetical protein
MFRIKYFLVTAALGLSFVACSGSPGIQDEGVSVKVFSGLTACDSTMGQRVFAGNDIGRQSNDPCSGYILDLSGSFENADSILVNFNGQEIAVTLNADGTFHAQIPTDTVPENVTVTPISVGGDAVSVPLVLDLTSIN